MTHEHEDMPTDVAGLQRIIQEMGQMLYQREIDNDALAAELAEVKASRERLRQYAFCQQEVRQAVDRAIYPTLAQRFTRSRVAVEEYGDLIAPETQSLPAGEQVP